MMDIREKLLKLVTGCPYEDLLEGQLGSCPKRKNGFCNIFSKLPYCSFGKLVDHLLANGVTVLPCKLGDTAWGIRRCHLGNVVKQGEVYQMYFGEDMRLCICVKNVCRGEWGVNVFGTKEEAEEAVGKMAKKE